MSAVDVRRILEQTDVALATAGLPEGDILRVELREARAAVAELVKADREFDDARLSGNAYRIADASARRRAALARVGGAT